MQPAVAQRSVGVALRRPGLGSGFQKLWAATAVSNVGDGIREAAFPLLAATLTRDPLLVAGVLFAGRLPWLVVGLPAGALADRLDRRRLMVVADVFRFGLLAALALSILSGGTTLIVVYAVAFLHGSAEALFDSASHAVVPALVRDDDLERANGRLEAATMVCNDFAGPPLGALMFSTVGALPFVVDAATFGVGAALVSAIRGRFVPQRGSDPLPSVREDIAEGLRWLWRSPQLRLLAGASAAINLAVHAAWAVFVLYALDVVGTGNLGFGVLLSVFALGGTMGGLAAAGLRRRFGVPATLVGAVTLAAVSELVMALSTRPFVVAAMLAALGFAGATWTVVAVAARQRLVSDELRGRVNGAFRGLAWGSIALGALLGGLVARAVGVRGSFFLASALLAGVAVLVAPRLRSAFNVRRQEPADPIGVVP